MRTSRSLILASLLAFPHLVLAQSTTLPKRSGSLAEPLSEIYAVEELSDGRVVISDFRERTLYLGDFRTGSLVPLGRQGSGPNEYSSVGPLSRVGGDTILAVDVAARRVLRIAPNGALGGTVPLDFDFSSVTFDREGMHKSIGGIRFIDAAGRAYFDLNYLSRKDFSFDAAAAVVRAEGNHVTKVTDAMAWYPTLSAKWRSPFMAQDLWAATIDGFVVRVIPTDYHVEWYRDGALVAKGAPAPFERYEVTAEDRRAWEERKSRQAGGTARMTGPPPSKETPRRQPRASDPAVEFPSTLPPYFEEFVGRSLRIARSGEAWVTRAAGVRSPTRAVDVFDRKGKRIRTLVIPNNAFIAGLGQSNLYLVQLDENDQQWLERYPITP